MATSSKSATGSSRDKLIIAVTVVAVIVAVIVIARTIHSQSMHVTRNLNLPPGTVANGKVQWMKDHQQHGDTDDEGTGTAAQPGPAGR